LRAFLASRVNPPGATSRPTRVIGEWFCSFTSKSRPLPRHEEMVIEDLSEDEGAAFLTAVKS
jgi:hypothetical protein